MVDDIRRVTSENNNFMNRPAVTGKTTWLPAALPVPLDAAADAWLARRGGSRRSRSPHY